MTPLGVAATVTVTVLAGAALGAWCRTWLPSHHLDDDTRDVVKVGIGFLSTLAALVLGLIVASAKTAFDTRSDEVHSAAARIALLAGELRQLGIAGDVARQDLRDGLAQRVEALWGTDGARSAPPGQWPLALDKVRATVRGVVPANDDQRDARSKALLALDQLDQLHSVAAVSAGSSVTVPLLVLLVAWMVVISLGINLFAPRNGTVAAFNVLCALSAAGAIFLILEMDQAFGGVIRVSDGPMRAALAQLAP